METNKTEPNWMEAGQEAFKHLNKDERLIFMKWCRKIIDADLTHAFKQEWDLYKEDVKQDAGILKEKIKVKGEAVRDTLDLMMQKVLNIGARTPDVSENPEKNQPDNNTQQ